MSPPAHNPLQVCYFGTYRAKYGRNQILIAGLRHHGVEVLECHEPLWQGAEDRIQAAGGGWRSPKFLWRVVQTYFRLLNRHRKIKAYDVLMVGYPGHFDVFLARLLSWLRRKPLVWDALNSLYLITTERGMNERSPLTIKLIRGLEKLACRLPERVLLDTPEFVAWFQETHRIPTRHFRLVQIGADDRIFQPLATPEPRAAFRVIYYGTYIPNHGVATIIEAARLLVDAPDIKIEMVGTGPEHEDAKALAQQYALPNVQFVDWVEREALTEHIAQADVVLGAFGTTRQLQLTNNNKIYEGFAMEKPVISARTAAMPKMLRHREHLYLCEPGDAAGLAKAIRTLKADPALRAQLVTNGQRIFQAHFNVEQIGQRVTGHLHELVEGRA